MNKTDQYFTPLLPTFQSLFHGRKRLSRKEYLNREVEKIKNKKLWEFRRLFSQWIPTSELTSTCSGKNSRSRVYNLEITFWAFLNQVFLGGTSCRETVKKVQSWMLQRSRSLPSSSTSAYCQARSRLPLGTLRNVFTHTVSVLDKSSAFNDNFHNRKVKVVDGTGLSMPDTPKNQKKYPQNGMMKEGCGFPQIKMVAIFSLFNGTLLGWAEGNKRNGENTLFRKLWNLFKFGDIVLGDRGFCSYANMGFLLGRGVDSVFRLHHARPFDVRKGIKLGENDSLVTWFRPRTKSKTWTRKEWNKLPSKLNIRLLKIPLIRKGFRTSEIIIATTLTDEKKYTAEDLGKLYFKRWSIELFFRDIKISMGMDILKSRTPEQIVKEITMYAICYNIIRGLILKAADLYHIDVEKISFKGTVQQLNQWLDVLINEKNSLSDFRYLMDEFYKKLVDNLLPVREGRSEPRTKKRRAKNYIIMNKPRKKMLVDCHRNRTTKKNAFYALT